MTASFLPSAEDQRVCAEFMTRFPVEGPGLCYLFGAYRARGLSREQAAAQVRARLAAETPPAGDPPVPPRARFLGALRLWVTFWLVLCLYGTLCTVILGQWRWSYLPPVVWLLGHGGLVRLTRQDQHWDNRMFMHLLDKLFPSAEGGQ
jgi:hypothetical protein